MTVSNQARSPGSLHLAARISRRPAARAPDGQVRTLLRVHPAEEEHVIVLVGSVGELIDRDGIVRHVDPGLAAEDAETIVWLLQEAAGSPWLPEPMEQCARSWVASLEELSGGLATT
jgi:hypothetical protein